jgi:hypothetical protein
MNIEADLGIDSIKRVEILGALQRACPPEAQKRLQESMESLTRAKTLRAILDLLMDGSESETMAGSVESSPAAAPAAERGPIAAAPRESPERQLLAIVSERTGYPPEMIDLAPRDRQRAHWLSARDDRPRHEHRGRPRHRLDQAGRDPRRVPARLAS